jgi:uncharacterized protein
MSTAIQEELIRQVMQQSGEQVSLAWQGGEPTLMGLDFYKRAVELEMKFGHGQQVGNGLQTNGLLLDKNWVSFLKEYNWLVGISLDGPEHIHNKFRFDKGDKGTHKRVEENAIMLQHEGVAANAMCVLTAYSVHFPDELYAYFKSLGYTHMQFIPIVETDKNNSLKAAYFSVSAVDYGNFLIRLFDLWCNDFVDGVPTTSIRYFESIFHTYVGIEAPECTLMKECGSYLVVEHNGNMYSCDFFVEPKWRVGNIMHDQIINLLNSKIQKNFGSAKAILPHECLRCNWLHNCYGGCTKDRIKDPADQGNPRFCISTKMFLSYADPILKKWAVQWKEQQAFVQMNNQPEDTYNAFDDFVF